MRKLIYPYSLNLQRKIKDRKAVKLEIEKNV